MEKQQTESLLKRIWIICGLGIVFWAIFLFAGKVAVIWVKPIFAGLF